MHVSIKISQLLLAFFLFAGNSAAIFAQEPAPAAANTCVGTVAAVPGGLRPIDDDALLQAAAGAPGMGKLCSGKVFVAEQPVTVYRVWDRAKAYTAYGSWWSFSQPQGPRERYRREEDICPEWSPLDVMSSCTLKIGTRIVVGPGQSVNCANQLNFPPSAENQVYIPNDSRNNKIYVENCTAGADWPESEAQQKD